MPKDFEKVKTIGLEAYQRELEEKIDILHYILDNYNDGRPQELFLYGGHLLDLQDIKDVLAQIAEEIKPEMSPKEKAAVVQLFRLQPESAIYC